MPLTITITPSTTNPTVAFLWITDEHIDADAVPVWPLTRQDLLELVRLGRVALAAMPGPKPRPLPLVDAAGAYLDSKAAARYMAFHTVRSFRQWARRQGIDAQRRVPGRVLLWKRADLDAYITADAGQ